MKLNESEKSNVLSSLESLLKEGESFHLTTTAIPIELYSEVRNWVEEVVRLLAPYNEGKNGLNLDILANENPHMINIGETFAELLPKVRICVKGIKNGTFDSWFCHLTTEEIIDCVKFL